MKRDNGYFVGCDGAGVYYQSWSPESAPRALILLAHGAGEHCARYEHVAEYYAQHGYVVMALDHAGHGRSDGLPGYVRRLDEYVDTLHVFQQQATAQHPDLPQVLLGHSMGGLIAVCYLLAHPEVFDACVLSGAAIASDIEPGVLQMLVIQVLSLVLPKAGVLQLDASGVSRDPEEVRCYREDPLVYGGKMSARLVSELFRGMKHVQDNAHTIETPLLILHGGEDSMTSPAGSRLLHEKVSSTQKQLIIYPELYHEIFNEPERAEVLENSLHWLERTLDFDPKSNPQPQ